MVRLRDERVKDLFMEGRDGSVVSIYVIIFLLVRALKRVSTQRLDRVVLVLIGTFDTTVDELDNLFGS